MKKLFVCCLFLCSCCIFLPQNWDSSITRATNYPYAKITMPNIAFYSSAIQSDDYIKFYLEQSYYVQLLENQRDGFYKAQYMDEIGYVLASNLTFVAGTPSVPYPTNISFRVFSLNGLNMRSSPIESQGPFNIITTIPYLANNLIYYGKVKGEEAVTYKGDIWYYAKYVTAGLESQPKGYLYSVFCDLLTIIPINTETLEVISEPVFETDIPQSPNDLFSTLPQSLQIIIVLSVSLPCLIIIYFLFKPTKISIDIGKNKHKKIRRLKKSDYYELED